MTGNLANRRELLKLGAFGAALGLVPGSSRGASPSPNPARGKAEACIFLWLGGGCGAP